MSNVDKVKLKERLTSMEHYKRYKKEDLVIRRATIQDKASVLGIHGNVYDGRDYLPSYYDHFMECPQMTSYVAVVGGNIVGFSAAFIIDDGTTVVTRAGRVSPQHAGTGVYSKLNQHIFKASRANINAFTAADANQFVFKESFLNAHMLLLSKPMTRYLVNAHNIAIPNEIPPSVLLKEMSNTDLEDYVISEIVKDYLFPKGRIVVDWVPFKLLPSNVPLMRPPRDTSVMLTDVTTHGLQARGLLSISTTCSSIEPPFACNLEIYGTDITTMKDHVSAHIKCIRDRTDGITSLLVFVEPHVEVAAEEVFGELGLVKSEWREYNPDKTYSRQYLFEKNI